VGQRGQWGLGVPEGSCDFTSPPRNSLYPRGPVGDLCDKFHFRFTWYRAFCASVSRAKFPRGDIGDCNYLHRHLVVCWAPCQMLIISWLSSVGSADLYL
jgi:hypothetical protein